MNRLLHVWEIKMHSGFGWVNLEERNRFRRRRIRWEDNIKRDLKEIG
jgi:hypothetical protein